MSTALRRVAAVTGAVIVAKLVSEIVKLAAEQIHPMPAGLDVTNREAVVRALEQGQFPMIRLGLLAAGWLLAAYFGGSMAARWGRWAPAVWFFAAIFTALVYLEMQGFPHPIWMWIAGIGGGPLFALGGGKLSISVPGPR
ncbi:MAG TPA: hypothetical protein PLL69_06175 [Gemmatimonadales bacterium]|nr:hypothetical protein [Gemmatimonadales bacterium]